MRMTQFDVFVNPIPAARSAYPFLVAMQSDFAPMAALQIVAPIATHSAFAAGGRITPVVQIRGESHAVLVPRLTAIPTADLTSHVGSLSQARSELLAALDFLFYGF